MEVLAWTIQHQSRLRGIVSPAHAAPGAQGRRGVSRPLRAQGGRGQPI